MSFSKIDFSQIQFRSYRENKTIGSSSSSMGSCCCSNSSVEPEDIEDYINLQQMKKRYQDEYESPLPSTFIRTTPKFIPIGQYPNTVTPVSYTSDQISHFMNTFQH